MEKLIVAGGNRTKVDALRRQLIGVATVQAPPPDISPEFDEDVAGTNETSDRESGRDDPFEEIARAKAAAWSRVLSRPASGEQPWIVATDGGLLIPGLGAAWNPARTRRFAGEAASAGERIAALLHLAEHLRGDDRRIGWREGLAVARDGRVAASWVAESPPGILAFDVGAWKVADDPFWVPLIWTCPEFGGRRLVELSPHERGQRPDHWPVLGAHLRRWLTTLAMGEGRS